MNGLIPGGSSSLENNLVFQSHYTEALYALHPLTRTLLHQPTTDTWT